MFAKIYLYGFVVAAALCVVYAAYHRGVKVTTAQYELVIKQIEIESLNQKNRLQQEYRAQERRHSTALYDISKHYEERMKDAQANTESVIADLKSDAKRLRQRFTCPASDSGVPATGASTNAGNDSQAGGLQQQDAEFLIRIAAEADAVSRQLAACQAVVAADRSENIMPTMSEGGR